MLGIWEGESVPEEQKKLCLEVAGAFVPSTDPLVLPFDRTLAEAAKGERD